MLEGIAGYLVLAPIVAVVLAGFGAATWVNRRRLRGARVATSTKKLA